MDVQVDTYNVGLAGLGVPAEAARRPALLAELAKMSGDFVCLQEVWSDADKSAVREAMKVHYPYAFAPSTTLATKIDEPARADGTTPAAPTAPCIGREAELDGGLACLKSKCATPDGRVTSTDCAIDNCVGEVATLLGASDKRCYACLAATLVSEKISDIATQCRSPGYGLGFGGQSSTMILSKHPLSETAVHVLPGCWQQRVLARATATLPNGAKLDILCNHLSSIDDDEFIPYVCPWGDGTSGKTAWEAEQILQAKRVAELAAKRSNRTIVLGDFNASPALAGTPGYGTQTLSTLLGGMHHAVPAGFSPQCTFCKDNALTGGTENGWLDHVFTRGFEADAIRSATRTFDAPVVDHEGTKVPLSDHYGMRVVPRVTPNP